jgi:hypothetical protein
VQSLFQTLSNIAPRKALAACIASGLVVRAVPLFGGANRILQQWPTEDGYLTLTIARNIALGKGLTVADGTVMTNGTQPLVTFIYSLGFMLSGGDRLSGVMFALLWQLAISAVAAWLMFRLVEEVFSSHPHRSWIAAIAAGAWYLSPNIVPHTMNCLETGTAVLVDMWLLLTWWRWVRTEPGAAEYKSAAKVGAMMALVAWARVDTVFLMTAIALAHLFAGLRRNRLVAAVQEVSIMATIAGVGIAPWLLFGKLTFGHWFPISGIAESLTAPFGGNAKLLPSKFFEYAYGVVGVPTSLEHAWWAIALFCVALGVWSLGFAKAVRAASTAQRQIIECGLLWALLLAGYYGFMFGAPHFVSRFLMPMSPLVFAASGLLAFEILRRLSPTLGYAVFGLATALVFTQHVRTYGRALPHMHWQVVQWVNEHVPDEVWVGAVQTGTLGFYHDRTLNFDGKVDPRALDAILADEHHQYIVKSDAQALIDWAGAVTFVEDGDVMKRAFAVREVDLQNNLAVLVRRGGPLDAGIDLRAK